jgi:hypothetical protein
MSRSRTLFVTLFEPPGDTEDDLPRREDASTAGYVHMMQGKQVRHVFSTERRVQCNIGFEPQYLITYTIHHMKRWEKNNSNNTSLHTGPVKFLIIFLYKFIHVSWLQLLADAIYEYSDSEAEE